MPRQIREILASVRETGDRGRNTGAPEKYGISGNPTLSCGTGLGAPFYKKCQVLFKTGAVW